MKLLRNMLVLALLVCSVATTGLAADRGQMDIAARDALDVFFSNFAETFTRPFTYNAVSNSELIKFGVMHVKINRSQMLRDYDAAYWAVAKQEVDNAAYKYFGKHIVVQSSLEFPLVGDEFLLIKASGEGVRFAQIDSLTDNNDGSYTAFLQEFVGESTDIHAKVQEPNVASVAKWRAVIVKAQDGSGRYNLKEYLRLS